ncbi:MAG TPA: hypothetical protein VFP84_24530 [Kofleriaceae bacterium]|nr:hypothetical protein [Kofleriaceae bacterium]
MTTTCRDAVTQLTAKQLATWHGLPARCTLDDLRHAGVELGDDETAATLGEAAEPATYRKAKLTGYAEYPMIWLRDAVIVQLSVDTPDLADLPRLLATLGPPTAKLDAWARTTPTKIPEAEWVWPARGLALRLSSDRKLPMQLIVFAPTTLEHYRAALRYAEPPRELAE